METKTPKKSNLSSNRIKWPSNTILLPNKIGSGSQGSLRVAQDIASDVYNNVQRWNTFHFQGAKLTTAIVKLKSSNETQYPDGLENLISELYEVAQQLLGTSKALDFLASQMSALLKNYRTPPTLFSSLENDQLGDLVRNIADAYREELTIKQYVVENIAHVKNTSNVTFLAVCWAYQANITKDIETKLDTLLTETGNGNNT